MTTEDSPDLEQSQVAIIADALQKVMADVKFARKDGRNTFQNYDYATESGVVAVTRESMHKHGLVLVPGEIKDIKIETSPSGSQMLTTFVQTYQLVHVYGAIWPFPIEILCQGADAGDKGAYKASTGGNKYMLLRLLQLPTGDDPEADNKTDEHEARPKAQPAYPRGQSSSPSPKTEPFTEEQEIEIASLDQELPAKPYMSTYRIYANMFSAAAARHSDDKFCVLNEFMKAHDLRNTNQLKVHHLLAMLQFAYDETVNPTIGGTPS